MRAEPVRGARRRATVSWPWLVALSVTAGLVGAAAPAEACFCAASCSAKGSSVVLEATIVAIGPSADPGLRGRDVVTLEDVRVVAGTLPRALVVGDSTCAYPFHVGGRYRIEGESIGAVHAGQRPATDAGLVWASQCGATRATWGWSVRAATVAALAWLSSSGCFPP